jgi:hypothetical protein
VLILLIAVAVLFAIVCEIDRPARLQGCSSGTIRLSKENAQEGSYLGTANARKGDTIKVDIANTEDETFYFMVSGYNIDEKVPPHKAAYFEFTADRKGEFWFGNFREKGEEERLVVE